MVASPYAGSAVDSKVHKKAAVADSEYEQQVSSARRERRVVDSRVQVLLNRISYLKAEEAKLDREFLRTQQRTEEMLLLKAERAVDDDVYEAARDVLDNLQKKGLSGKNKVPGPAGTHAGRAPPCGHTHQGKDTTDRGHSPALGAPVPLPAKASKRSSTPGTSACSSRRASSSGCLPPNPCAAQAKKPGLAPASAVAAPSSSRTLVRCTFETGPASAPRQAPHTQHMCSSSSSSSCTPRQQQQQQQQQRQDPRQPGGRPAAAAGRPPSAPLATTSGSASAADKVGPPDHGRLVRSVSEGHTPAGPTTQHEPQPGPATVGQCAAAADSKLPQGGGCEGGGGSGSGSGSSSSSSSSGGTPECGRLLELQRAAEAGSVGCAGANTKRLEQQLVLLPPDVDGCLEVPEDLSSTAACVGGATNKCMQLLSQGVTAELPEEEGLQEGGGKGPQPSAHSAKSAQPTQMAGLQQFSTQMLPRVVHAKASAPKPPPAAPGGLVQTAVLGVGWGMGAIRFLGDAADAGADLQLPPHVPVQPQTPQQQQQQAALPRASPASSKALRPSSSLGRTGSTKGASTEGNAVEDIRQRQQIWALRRTFGLAPIVMHDSTAQLQECGAGAWK